MMLLNNDSDDEYTHAGYTHRARVYVLLPLPVTSSFFVKPLLLALTVETLPALVGVVATV